MATSAASPSLRRPRRIRLAILISSSTTRTRIVDFSSAPAETGTNPGRVLRPGPVGRGLVDGVPIGSPGIVPLFGEAHMRDGGELHPHVRPALVAVGGARRTAVGLRDGGGDGQAEAPPAARAGLVGAREALERARQEVRRESGPVVADVQLHGPVAAAGAQDDV